jgi:hypothetical protein
MYSSLSLCDICVMSLLPSATGSWPSAIGTDVENRIARLLWPALPACIAACVTAFWASRAASISLHEMASDRKGGHACSSDQAQQHVKLTGHDKKQHPYPQLSISASAGIPRLLRNQVRPVISTLVCAGTLQQTIEAELLIH